MPGRKTPGPANAGTWAPFPRGRKRSSTSGKFSSSKNGAEELLSALHAVATAPRAGQETGPAPHRLGAGLHSQSLCAGNFDAEGSTLARDELRGPETVGLLRVANQRRGFSAARAASRIAGS